MAGGQQTDLSQGTVTPDESVALSGEALTLDSGTIVAEGTDGALALEGEGFDTASGQLASAIFIGLRSRKVGAGSASRALTGISMSYSTGTLAQAALIRPVGQSITTGQGSFTKSRTRLLTGQAATLQQGTVSPPQTALDPPITLNNVYVKVASSGTGTGADWTNAIAYSSVTFARNTTYWIADGAYTARTHSTANNGSLYIVIRKATVAEHGTATGWNSADGDGQAVLTGQTQVTTDFWWFDGRSRDTAWYSGSVSAYGFRFVSNGAKTLRIDNTGSGSGADDCTFKYIDMVGAGRDSDGNDIIYSLYRNLRVNVQNCALRDCGRCPWISAGGTLDRLVEYCYIARNTSTPAVHAEPFSCWGTDTNSIYRYNVIEDCEGTAIWAFINTGDATNTQIYGNTIQYTSAYVAVNNSRPSHTKGVIFTIFVGDNISGGNGNTMAGLRYYGNSHFNFAAACDSAYDVPASLDIQHYGEIPPLGGTNNECRNNIWSLCRGADHICSGAVTHNYYHNTPFGAADTNAQSSASSPFVNASSGDFHLAAATTAGFALGTTYSTDRDSNIRGGDGIWDRGAFEFIGVDPSFRFVKTAATGTGDGLSWTNAMALPGAPTRGLVYWLAGGAYGNKTWSTATSGTTLCTIKKATVSSHGTSGTAGGWSDAFDTAATFTSWNFTSNNWLVDGQSGGGPGSWDTGHGFSLFDIGSIIEMDARDNITIRHTKALSNRTTADSSCIHATVTSLSNVTISYCYFGETYGPILWFRSGTNITVEHSLLSHNRSEDAFHSEGVSTIDTCTNIVFRWNLWDRCEGTAVIAGINGVNAQSWKVYGNIFSRCPTAALQWSDPNSPPTMSNAILHNNTIVDCGGNAVSQGGFTIFDDGSANGTGNSALNNLFYQNNYNSFGWSRIAHNYSYASKNIRTEGGNFDKDAEILSGEANGQNGSDGNPFVGYNANPLIANYQATTTAGFSTTATLPGNDVDMFGNSRAAGGWRRGAIA